MARWFRAFSYIVGSLVLILALTIGITYIYQYRVYVAETNTTLSDWKKSNWISSKDYELVTKALVAAENPTFYTIKHSGCEISDLLSGHPRCSPIIAYATRLVASKPNMRGFEWMFVGWLVQSDLSERPDEAIDIILNRAYFGQDGDSNNIIGFAQAANFYFGKQLGTLSISKIAMLAGIIRMPSRFSPKIDSKKAKDRRDAVIDQMAKASFISEIDATTAKNDPL